MRNHIGETAGRTTNTAMLFASFRFVVTTPSAAWMVPRNAYPSRKYASATPSVSTDGALNSTGRSTIRPTASRKATSAAVQTAICSSPAPPSPSSLPNINCSGFSEESSTSMMRFSFSSLSPCNR